MNMLAGNPLRREDGGDNGVRVFDINADGFMDVLIANKKAKVTRIWQLKKVNGLIFLSRSNLIMIFALEFWANRLRWP